MSEDGSPGGYLILRYRGGRADWQFKPNGYRADRNQFRVYDLNRVPGEFGGQPGSNRCLINVYNWDERWTVRVRGERPRPESRTGVGQRPLYILIRRDALPTRPTAFRAVANPHMFSGRSLGPGHAPRSDRHGPFRPQIPPNGRTPQAIRLADGMTNRSGPASICPNNLT